MDAPIEAHAAAATAACPVCDGHLTPAETPDYAACGRCGTRVSLVPEGSYGSDYYYHQPEHDRRWSARAQGQVGHLRRIQAAVARADGVEVGPRRLLELGCAKGFFVEAALGAGHDAFGVDLSVDAVAAGRDRGIEGRLFCGDARHELPFGDSEGFDLVVVWELLEHMDDPAGFLATCAEHLRPGGWVVGSTPNGESSWLSLLGEHWHGFDIPQFHRVYLGPRAFGACAERAGLDRSLTLTTTERSGSFLLKNVATGLSRRVAGSDALPLRAGAAAALALPVWTAERASGHVPGLAGDTLLFAAQRPHR